MHRRSNIWALSLSQQLTVTDSADWRAPISCWDSGPSTTVWSSAVVRGVDLIRRRKGRGPDCSLSRVTGQTQPVRNIQHWEPSVAQNCCIRYIEVDPLVNTYQYWGSHCVRQQGQRVLERLQQEQVQSELQVPPGCGDHQGSLNRILNKAAADIIDISVMDQTPGLLEHQDILDRSSMYNKRLAAGLTFPLRFPSYSWYFSWC